MKIAIAQIDLVQGDFDVNLTKVTDIAQRAKNENADIVVFPEMFLCGFDYRKNLQYLKTNGTKAEDELCKIAKENNICLCGSIPHLGSSDQIPSNRFLFVNSDGEISAFYDKTHLFSVFNEDKYVKKGNEIVVASTKFGRIGFAICYDIRFPDMFVKMAKNNAKLMIISAAFPHPRSEHWRILTKARAIENQCFVVAVNRGGTEKFGKNEIKYFGMSAVIDAWGSVIEECPQDEESLKFVTINLDEVDNIRSKIPAFADRRDDLY